MWEIKSLFYQTPTSGEIPLLPKIHQESHLSLRRPNRLTSFPPLKKPDSFLPSFSLFFLSLHLLLNRRVRAVALLLLRLRRRLLRGGLLGICCCCRLLLLLLVLRRVLRVEGLPLLDGVEGARVLLLRQLLDVLGCKRFRDVFLLFSRKEIYSG